MEDFRGEMPEKRRRTASESEFDVSYGASRSIPTKVSYWTESDLNKIGVSYVGNGESAHGVLNRDNNICKLESLPKEILDTIKYLSNTLTFEIKTNARGEIDLESSYQAREINKALNKVYEGVEDSDEDIMCMEQETRRRVLDCYGYVRAFLRQLSLLVSMKSRKEAVYEQCYTDMISTFGGMCGLVAQSGNVIRRLLTVGDRDISSQPDIRFLSRYQIKEWNKCQTVVSIAEVRNTQGDARAEADDAASGSSDFSIHKFLNAKVLGQHGGELIADWKHSVTFSSISGMIVCGSKVVVTWLPLNLSEYDEISISGKLKNMKQIYYSVPLDILKKDERQILYEVFFRLAETRSST